nr:hypothetical protein CFP56_42401 [Quercus suber]
MTTRFSEQKLAEAQEKKAKGGTVSGLLSKKKTGDVFEKEFVTSIPPAHSPAKRPASPTSSLEMIDLGGEEIKKKKKTYFLPTFWDDADAAALKAYEALSVDDLNPLMAKSSGEVISSHIQKLMQALGESLFISGKLLDLEKKVATSEPLVKSLSAKNETLKNKVAILTAEVENDKERVIGDIELKLENVGATTIQDFKDSDEYSDELYKYYMEGFDLLMKWMAKYHPSLELSGLAMDDVEKELLSIEATMENVMEEAIDIAEGMKEATVITPTDPILDKL